MLPVHQLAFRTNAKAATAPAGFVRAHDVRLLAIWRLTILVPTRCFRLRISDPLDKAVHHEPAPIKQTAEKTINAIGTNREVPQPKTNSPNESDITEIALKKS